MTDITELERRVSALEAEAKHHKTRDDRIVGFLTELKEDTALLRRHAIASGQKIEQLQDELSAMRKEFAAFPSLIAETMREVLHESK